MDKDSGSVEKRQLDVLELNLCTMAAPQIREV
jgi:hypothetical protein